MWVSYQMSILTWPTRLTDINTKGQAEATELPSSLGHPCQPHFHTYPVLTSPSSPLARGGGWAGDMESWVGPCGWRVSNLRSPPTLLPSIFYTKDRH